MNKKNRPLRVFISGKMRGKRLYGFPEMDEARDKLKAAGYDVVSPADLDREVGFDPTEWTGWCLRKASHSNWTWLPDWLDLDAAMKRDLEELRKCDGVALLDGWHESEGAMKEVRAAANLGIPAWHVCHWLLKAVKKEKMAERLSESDTPLPRAVLPDDASERKKYPLYRGLLRYFPDALAAVARCSWEGNEQHHPGTELHWDKNKSTDEPDALLRHMLEAEDSLPERAKVAWRALAWLQRGIEGGVK